MTDKLRIFTAAGGKFGPYLRASLHSFLQHNPNAPRVTVMNCGLSCEDYDAISKVADIKDVLYHGGPYPPAHPRLKMLASLNDGEIGLSFDADSLWHDSIDAMLDRFANQSADIAVKQEDVPWSPWPTQPVRKCWKEAVPQAFPYAESWGHLPVLNSGFML